MILPPLKNHPEADLLEHRLARLVQSAPKVETVAAQHDSLEGEALQALIRLGDAPVDLAIRHKAQIGSLFEHLDSDTPFDHLQPLLDGDLSAFKQIAWLRILLRESLELTTLVESMSDLSELADRVTRAAFASIAGKEEYSSLLMLALGKWGARELNVASDIDPVFFAPASIAGQPGDQLVRRWLSVLAVRPGREIYDVDLRLRPEGSQGPLVTNFSELERYFFQRSAPWERIAWLRARPVSGEMPGWVRQLLDAFLFGSVDDPRERVTEAARALMAVRRSAKARDIKRVPGGIRDVEFLVASLQLSFGKSIPSLREGTILELLETAAAENVLRESDAETLASGYRFARQVEHLMQARHGIARFVVPSPGQLEHNVLALQLGFTPEEFESHWTRHRTEIASLVAKHLPMDTGIHESALLAVDPQGEVAEPRLKDSQSEATLRRLGEGRIDLRELYDPQVLANHPNEAETLLLLESSVRAFGGTTSWRQAFGKRRDLRKEMTKLLLYAPRVIEIAIQHPYLFERIGLRGSKVQIDGDAEQHRQKLNDLLFHLGERFISGDMSAGEFTDHWSNGVDEVLALRADRELASAPRPVALIGLGKWGGRELAPDADLDLVFVCEDGEAHEVAATVKRGTDFLSSGSLNGTLLLDPRLRPEGSGAPMVITRSRLEEYLASGRAQPWEKMALIRARFIGGDREVGREALSSLQRFSTAPPTPQQLREINRARRKASELQRALNGVARIKKALGGMMDFEFASTAAGWNLDREIEGEWWSLPIATRLRDLAAWTGDSLYDEAAEAYTELRRWELVQWASGIGKRGLISLEGEEAFTFSLAASLTPDELAGEWRRISSLGQTLYLRHFPQTSQA